MKLIICFCINLLCNNQNNLSSFIIYKLLNMFCLIITYVQLECYATIYYYNSNCNLILPENNVIILFLLDSEQSLFVLRTVMGEQKFECVKCRRQYKQKHGVIQHLRYECGKEPQFSCPHCPHKSKIKSNLTYHFLSKHKNMFKWCSFNTKIVFGYTLNRLHYNKVSFFKGNNNISNKLIYIYFLWNSLY